MTIPHISTIRNFTKRKVAPLPHPWSHPHARPELNKPRQRGVRCRCASMNLFSVRQPDLHDALPVHDAPHDAPPPRLPGPGSSAPWPAAPRSRRAAPSPSPGSHPRRPPPGSAAPWSAAPRRRRAAASPSPGSRLRRPPPGCSDRERPLYAERRLRTAVSSADRAETLGL